MFHKLLVALTLLVHIGGDREGGETGKPFNIAIVQLYAPTSASTDDEIEEFYNLL